MRLQPSPFEKVRKGRKTIEIRINDQKRQALEVGDKIEFSLMTDPTQSIETEILGLNTHPTFKELFAAYPPEQYGGENQGEWELMYQYYSREEEEKYGVVAIKLKV